MFNEEGDFAGKYPRGFFDVASYTYPNANLIYAAVILRQFDLSTRGIKFLLEMQDKESGGFYNLKDSPKEKQIEDIAVSCQDGLACILTGHMEEASRVVDFVENIYNMQPDIENKLYFVYSPKKKKMITEFSKEEARPFVIDVEEPKQFYYVPGLAAAFLCRMYMADPKERYLDLAKKYLDFAIRCSDEKYRRPQIGKVGWGASLLYQITGDARYRDVVLKVGEHYVRDQNPEGYWLNTVFDPKILANEHHQIIELTAENIFNIDTILTGLSLLR
jgi:hypothetical protein